jgi:glutathione S-transferase
MLKIYGVPISVHTRKVIVVALAKKLEHEVIPVVPVIPGNPPSNWRELSPTGKIPALTDGDFTVAGLSGDLRLSREDPSGRAGVPFYATRLRHRVVVRAVRGRTVSRCGASVVPGNLRLPEDPESGDESAARRPGARRARCQRCSVIWTLCFATDYLAGDRAGVADFAVVSNLITYQYIGFDLYRERFRRLAAFFDRVLRHPAMTEALRREQPVVDSMGLKRDWHVQDR